MNTKVFDLVCHTTPGPPWGKLFSKERRSQAFSEPRSSCLVSLYREGGQLDPGSTSRHLRVRLALALVVILDVEFKFRVGGVPECLTSSHRSRISLAVSQVTAPTLQLIFWRTSGWQAFPRVSCTKLSTFCAASDQSGSSRAAWIGTCN